MTVTVTLIILGASLAVFLWARHEGEKPPENAPSRHIPYNGVMLLAGFVALLMIVHLINLAGIETGRR